MAAYTTVLVLLAIYTRAADAIKCMECTDMPDPQDCTTITECSAYETCHVTQFITTGGLVLYNSGCIAKNRCTTKKRDVPAALQKRQDLVSPLDILTCVDCCDKEYCNLAGCGITGLRTPQRGPVCFSCNAAADPKKCRDVLTCSDTQVCSLYQHYVGPDLVYTSKCDEKSRCIGFNGRRGLLQRSNFCFKCCTDDFCNQDCGPSSHLTTPIPTPSTPGTTKLITTKSVTKSTTQKLATSKVMATSSAKPATQKPATKAPATTKTSTHKPAPTTIELTTLKPATPTAITKPTTKTPTHAPAATKPTTHKATRPKATTRLTTHKSTAAKLTSTATTQKSTAPTKAIHKPTTKPSSKPSTKPTTTKATTTKATTTKATSTKATTTKATTTKATTTKATTTKATTTKATTTKATTKKTTTRLTTTKPTPTTTTIPTTTKDPEISCKKQNYIYDSHLHLCMKFHTNPRLNWTEALHECEKDNGTLAVITSDAKAKDVQNFISSHSSNQQIAYWVGANDQTQAHVFTWLNGETIVFQGNSTLDLTQANCLYIDGPTKADLKFEPCKEKHAYICEKKNQIKTRSAPMLMPPL